MKPEEFKERFINALPEIPPDIKLDPSEFVQFDRALLDSVGLSEMDKELLTLAGLPKDAAPFLSFYSDDRETQARVGGIPEDTSCFALGSNGYGDAIVIDLQNGEIVYFNHDRNMEKVFINSNLTRFAESLCIFTEHLPGGRMEDCLAAIERVDEAVEKEEASGL